MNSPARVSRRSEHHAVRTDVEYAAMKSYSVAATRTMGARPMPRQPGDQALQCFHGDAGVFHVEKQELAPAALTSCGKAGTKKLRIIAPSTRFRPEHAFA